MKDYDIRFKDTLINLKYIYTPLFTTVLNKNIAETFNYLKGILEIFGQALWLGNSIIKDLEMWKKLHSVSTTDGFWTKLIKLNY